jgi:hypothetical protein
MAPGQVGVPAIVVAQPAVAATAIISTARRNMLTGY